jgi:hypothetical protein
MMILRLVWRLIAICLAIFFACAAASAIIIVGIEQLYETGNFGPDALTLIASAFLLPIVAVQEGGYMVAGLVAVGIVLAEAFRLRSWLIYAAAGAIIGAVIVVWAESGYQPNPTQATLASRDMMLFIAAGLAGGLVYWLIAGRKAGKANPEMGART